MSSCRLLDRVAYCMREPSQSKNIYGDNITVYDAFPYNPESKTAPKTAALWARRTSYDNGVQPETIVRDNEPFSITITSLEVRNEGGRAYKVVDDEMRRFDLREDQLVDVIKRHGISPGGKINAKFVWGILGSQVRLVLVDGDLYNRMNEGTKNNQLIADRHRLGLAPTPGSLVPGRVYRKKDKSLHLFLGRVKSPDASNARFAFVELPDDEPRRVDDVDNDDSYRHTDKPYKDRLRMERQVSLKWPSMSWKERCQHEWVDRWVTLREARNQLDKDKAYTAYPAIVLMTSPKFVEDVGVVDDEFWQSIKANKDLNFKYGLTSGWEADLHMRWKYGNNHYAKLDARFSYPTTDIWQNSSFSEKDRHEEYDRRRKECDLEVAKVTSEALAEYRDACVWL